MFFSYNEELTRSEHRVAHEHPWCGCPDSEEERRDVECWISELERGMNNVCVCVSMCPCWCKTKLMENNRRGRKKEGGEISIFLLLILCLFLCLFFSLILSLSLSLYRTLSLSSSPSLSSLHPLLHSVPLYQNNQSHRHKIIISKQNTQLPRLIQGSLFLK